MKQLWLRMRSAWRVMTRSNQLEAETRDEMRFHVDMERARLMREQGLSHQEARRQALVRFGALRNTRTPGATYAGCGGLKRFCSIRGLASACSSSIADSRS